MKTLNKYVQVLEKAKETSSQPEVLQKLIQEIKSNKIIELEQIPLVGDKAYVLIKASDGFTVLSKLEIKGIYRMYETKEAKYPTLFFAFGEEDFPYIEDWTEEDWDNALTFPASEQGKSFFFNRKDGIKALHNLCGLSEKHISLAKTLFHPKNINITDEALQLFYSGMIKILFDSENTGKAVIVPFGKEWIKVMEGAVE